MVYENKKIILLLKDKSNFFIFYANNEKKNPLHPRLGTSKCTNQTLQWFYNLGIHIPCVRSKTITKPPFL